ncbi:MAG: DUF1565 domain-containing protein [Candidatus Aminicenantes bacterium]|nr:DUF1565 domain-containing protein [Candidatus Aminicenantes bacterium]
MASKISFSHVGVIILVLFLTRPSPPQLRNKNRHRIVAARYYVSPSGDDSNPGTIQSPWRTIQHAADSVNPGDTVQVKAGFYQEAVQLHRDGLANSPIRFEAYPGEIPVIEGREIGLQTCVWISGNHVHFDGFEIRNCETGLEITGHHIEISSCHVHDLWFGISPHNGAHDFILRNVDIYNFLLYGFDASRWRDDEPVCHHGFFYECKAHDCLDPEQNVDGFAFGDGHDFVFDHCSVYYVHDGFDIKADNTTLNRCLTVECSNSGYKLWGDNIALVSCLGYDNGSNHVELDWDGTPGRSFLVNCTFVHSKTYGIWLENSQDRLQMYNCILADGENIGLCIEHGGVECYEGDHNIFHNDNHDRVISVGYMQEFSIDQIRAGEWTSYSGQDQHSMVSTVPRTEIFLNMGKRDLHLFQGSLAVDRGTLLNAPSVDHDCMIRPAGGGYDIGAYEYGSTIDLECAGEIKREKKGKLRR